MKRTLLWLALVLILGIAFLLYRSRSADRLDVTPDAAREIEKAKKR